jgi:hypothetical protein
MKVTEGEKLEKGTLGRIDLHNDDNSGSGYEDRHGYTEEHPYWILEGFHCARFAGSIRTATNELGKVFNNRIAKDNWDAFSSGLKKP